MRCSWLCWEGARVGGCRPGARQAPFIGARPATPSCHPSRRRLGQILNPAGFERRPLSVFPCGTLRRCPAFLRREFACPLVKLPERDIQGARQLPQLPP